MRGPFDPAYRLISVALLALITIIAFEAMAISTAMPSAARDLDAVRSYGLAFSVMLTAQLLGIVLAGVWVDRAGPLPSLFTGQVLLAGGSGLCAVSGSLAPFLLGRAVTGLGAGLIVVTGYVLVGRTYPEAIRPRVFSMLSAAWVLPSLVGAPIAAWLTSTWSWRAVFGIVVVPVVATIAVVAAPARPDRRPSAPRSGTPAATTAPTSEPPGRAGSSPLRPGPSSSGPTSWRCAGPPGRWWPCSGSSA